jgi:phosphoglycolate phosphatase-like HAD superfamily hydrolase
MKLFIWDFHGVLEKDNEKAVMEITNIVLSQSGYSEKLNINDCHRFYGLRWFQYFERLLPLESHGRHLELTKLCVETENKYKITAKHIKANDFAEEVLGKIQRNGHNQILISNTNRKSLIMFLAETGLSKFFPKGTVFAADNHRGHKQKSKKEIFGKYLKDKSFEKIVVVGDSADDIELASVSRNSVSYLYAHPWKKFRECKADYKINDLREVLKEL